MEDTTQITHHSKQRKTADGGFSLCVIIKQTWQGRIRQRPRIVRCDDPGFLAKYQIRYSVVLAYMSEKRNKFDTADHSDTILPEGIETVLNRFAINYWNKWMIEQSDFVVTNVVHDAVSGAAQFKRLAERKGKKVVELR